MKRMYPIVLDIIKENRSNDPDVIARNLRISVHYRSLPKHLKGLLIKTPFSKDIVIAHTCLRNSPKMIDSIRNEKELTFNDTIELLKIFERTGCYI